MIINPFKLAKDVFYNNKSSKLSSTNVQGAVDELHGIVNAKAAADIPYNNNGKVLKATNVQTALDTLGSVFKVTTNAKTISIPFANSKNVWIYTPTTDTVVNICASCYFPYATEGFECNVQLRLGGTEVATHVYWGGTGCYLPVNGLLLVPAGTALALQIYHRCSDTINVTCRITSNITGTFYT